MSTAIIRKDKFYCRLEASDKVRLPQADQDALEEHAKTVRETQAKVRKVTAESVMRIGEELSIARDRLANFGNGTFGKWVAHRCGISKSAAYRAIAAYYQFKDCPSVGQTFEPSAMYLLASDKTPEEAVDSAKAHANRGKLVTAKVARRLLDYHTQKTTGNKLPAETITERPAPASEPEPIPAAANPASEPQPIPAAKSVVDVMPAPVACRASTLDEVGDPDAPKGSRPWVVAVIRLVRQSLQSLETDARLAGGSLKMLCEAEAWKSFGYASWGILCVKEFKLTEDQAEALVKAKKGDPFACWPASETHVDDPAPVSAESLPPPDLKALEIFREISFQLTHYFADVAPELSTIHAVDALPLGKIVSAYNAMQNAREAFSAALYQEIDRIPKCDCRSPSWLEPHEVDARGRCTKCKAKIRKASA